MNARGTTVSTILTVLAASSIFADGAGEAVRQRPLRLTGPDPSEFKIDKLKDLCLDTALVKGGRANVTIIKPDSGMYDAQATAITAAIRKLTGVEPPIATDQSPAGAVPIQGHLIALGNRSTNATIGELYNRHFTLLDLRYRGKSSATAAVTVNSASASRYAPRPTTKNPSN
jgi:hypothetical protein